MRGVAGSIGIILTVPLVSLFASVLMKIKFKFIDSPVVSEGYRLVRFLHLKAVCKYLHTIQMV